MPEMGKTNLSLAPLQGARQIRCSVVSREKFGHPLLTALTTEVGAINRSNHLLAKRIFCPKRSDDIRVFNLLGEEIETLLAGVLSPGKHVVRWDATGKPSGIYFCRLEANGFVLIRKLTLVR